MRQCEIGTDLQTVLPPVKRVVVNKCSGHLGGKGNKVGDTGGIQLREAHLAHLCTRGFTALEHIPAALNHGRRGMVEPWPEDAQCEAVEV